MDILKRLEKLKTMGYLVEKLTPYQYRIECVLDLYIVHHRYHNVADGSRGYYPKELEKLKAMIDAEVAKADAILDQEIASGRMQEESKQHGPWLNEKNKPWFTKVQR